MRVDKKVVMTYTEKEKIDKFNVPDMECFVISVNKEKDQYYDYKRMLGDYSVREISFSDAVKILSHVLKDTDIKFKGNVYAVTHDDFGGEGYYCEISVLLTSEDSSKLTRYLATEKLKNG